ncbi:MAG: hypothetical protein KKC99_07820, partial [Proteobacteria bacterium]|nr:hypothetical protein [Pseudomonadota bacterium]
MTQKARKLLSLALYVVPIFMLLVLLHNVHSEWENAENIKYSMFSRQNTDFSNEVQLRIEGILTERLNDLALLSGIIDHMSGQERLEEFSQSAAGVVQREQSFHVLNYI